MKKSTALKTTSLAVAAAGLLLTAPAILDAQTSKPSFEPASMPASKAVEKATEWKVDPAHTSLVFNISHLGVSNVWGRFNDVSGTIHFDPENLEGSSIHVKVQIASVDTGIEGRDKHLRNADYFDAENNTLAEFKSAKIEHVDGDVYEVTGELTMMGKSEPLTSTFTWNGITESEQAGTRTGADAEFTLDRVHWGIGDEGPLGTDVPVRISIEATKV